MSGLFALMSGLRVGTRCVTMALGTASTELGGAASTFRAPAKGAPLRFRTKCWPTRTASARLLCATAPHCQSLGAGQGCVLKLRRFPLCKHIPLRLCKPEASRAI